VGDREPLPQTLPRERQNPADCINAAADVPQDEDSLASAPAVSVAVPGAVGTPDVELAARGAGVLVAAPAVLDAEARAVELAARGVAVPVQDVPEVPVFAAVAPGVLAA
jgi:hypothetical protein